MKQFLFLLLFSSPLAAQAQWDLDLPLIHRSLSNPSSSGGFEVTLRLVEEGWEDKVNTISGYGSRYITWEHPDLKPKCETCERTKIITDITNGTSELLSFTLVSQLPDSVACQQMLLDQDLHFVARLKTYQKHTTDPQSETRYRDFYRQGGSDWGAMIETTYKNEAHQHAYFSLWSWEDIQIQLENLPKKPDWERVR